jgi:hypothetical protein
MSAKFCLWIPAKISRIEKQFPDKLRAWAIEHLDPVPDYSLYTLSEFRERSDVSLDSPEIPPDRYYVLDWGFYFPPSPILQDLLRWFASMYPYGEVGVLQYWSDEKKRFPPITIASEKDNITHLSAEDFPLDRLFFVPLLSIRYYPILDHPLTFAGDR